MSRIAKKPVELVSGVSVDIKDQTITVKGPKGSASMEVHSDVDVKEENGALVFSPKNDTAMPLTGTMRALVNNMVVGLTDGYSRKLELVGVGYRASMQGNDLKLALGFSHDVVYKAPEGISFEVSKNQTEIVVTGTDKQVLGQVCAEIRAYRPPEPYKGKGVRYSDERVFRKEAKKA
ncbi:MAG TPA: 50S ribosomal protein L6 [Gammaproteobacteria bacterium]|nr:50S ribosomal protein L6 [Xanthomonadales bacterium]MCB1593566.1 50S ribosomal protein L6 [Xanthomonadales bacterium]HOP22365.1 50S ribosomal protein L6 [Gammaproteobacteria bacterium]HPI95542.1 50S ribosomal protein L6 [Gammaproteobacteria bacterium]HPQ86767.1 50S ribosomal protein L6 [Gammaproteobacteria bacterium]